MRKTFPSAAHLFLIKNNQILLSRRYNTGYEDGNYSVVAGHLDGDEKVLDAMIREAREEVGIELREEDLEVVGVMHRKSRPPLVDERIDFFLVAYKWTGKIINNEPDKCDDLQWIDCTTLENLPENTIPYIRRAIENFKNNKWFDSFGL